MAITYNKETDYQKLINDAVARGDNESAAVYEQQRNAKIRGEGISGVQTTNNYSQFLPDTGVIDSIVKSQNPPKLTTDQANAALDAIEKSRNQGVTAYSKSEWKNP